MQNVHTGHEAYLHPILQSNQKPSAVNITATLTAAQILNGVVTSTSLSAVTMTTPTATAIVKDAGLLPATYYDFIIDNSIGANTVTLSLDASITALAVVTGGNTLTVAATKVGIFRLYFYSLTAAFIARLA